MVDLASWIGLLSPDGELSDYGVALRWLGLRSGRPSTSPASVLAGTASAPAAEGYLLLWLLMRADLLLAALLGAGSTDCGEVERRELEPAISRLITAAEGEADPDDLVPAPELRRLLARAESEPDWSAMARNVRLEMLAALGILARAPGAEDRPEWLDTPRSESLASSLVGVRLTRSGLAAFLDRGFFAALAPSRRSAAQRPVPAEMVLLHLTEAYAAIRRPLGFTPGRPLALLVAILAAIDGLIVEIDDVYECVYGASRGRWSRFLDFSGGSRFDREFLLRIDPELRRRLESSGDR